jgi:acyl-CoA thioesterase FadM
MTGYPYEIRPLETDIFDNVPPSHMIRACLYGNMRQSEAEGLPSERLYDELGAVWMLARLKLTQSAPLHTGDCPELRVTSRAIDGGTYIRCVDVALQERSVAKAELVYIVVRLADRHILRPAAVEEMWQNPRPLYEAPVIHRLRAPGELEDLGSVIVRYCDCDKNGHFSSPNYADLVCDAVDYWRGAPALMESLQIDFSSEVKPLGRLQILRAAAGDRYMVVGKKDDGVTAFLAECTLRKLDS